MKKKLFIALGLAGLITLSISIGVYAASDIKLFINGKAINADIQTINGSSYVPLRVVSESLGAQVKWDGDTKTISITSGTSAATPPPVPAPTPTVKPTPTPQSQSEIGFSRRNPAPSDTILQFSTPGTNGYDGHVSVGQVIRGKEAWDLIYKANQFNSAPKEGYEYVLAKVSFGIYSNQNSDAKVSVNRYQFTLVSEAGSDYTNLNATVVPEPSLDASLYAGASQTGWVAYQVKIDDLNPLLTYGRANDGTGGMWFKLEPTAGSTTSSPSPSPTPIPSTTSLSTAGEIQKYLDDNFGTLDTIIGKTSFKFVVEENDRSFLTYDYWVKVHYDYNFFGGAMTSIKYTDDQKNSLRAQLKQHQENLARALIQLAPTKKFYGGYFDSYYKYPNLQMDLVLTLYYSWTNYDRKSLDDYSTSKPSTFQWYDLIDNKL